MGKLSRLAVVAVIVALAALVTPGCGDDDKQPCQPVSQETLRQLRTLNRALAKRIKGEKKPSYFVLTEEKRDLMATFPKLYGVALEDLYNRLKDLDEELEAAIEEKQAGRNPTDALKRAKSTKDSLKRLLAEAPNVPKEVKDQLELMNKKLTELIETQGGDPEQFLIDAMVEEKRKLMELFRKPYGVPFPDVYFPLKAIDDELDQAFKLEGAGMNPEGAYRDARIEKKKLEDSLRKVKCP